MPDVFVENGDECITAKSPTNGFVAENTQGFCSGGDSAFYSASGLIRDVYQGVILTLSARMQQMSRAWLINAMIWTGTDVVSPNHRVQNVYYQHVTQNYGSGGIALKVKTVFCCAR